MRLNFCSRAVSLHKKASKVLICSAAVSLGNVRHNRYSGPTYLICEPEIFREISGSGQFIYTSSRDSCLLPRLNLFKSFEGSHNCVSNTYSMLARTLPVIDLHELSELNELNKLNRLC